MENSNINSIELNPLKRIEVENGDVLHGLKNYEKSFKGFGEAYFSFINYDKKKAWKKHKEMTLNLIVPFGMVKVALIDSEKSHKTVIIGEKNYCRLTVPPNIWFGFMGLSRPNSIILNIADIRHDPSESERKPVDYFKFHWGV